LVLLINVYALSSTKLEIKAKQFLPGSKGDRGTTGGGRGKRGEMTQTLYTHLNKRNKKKKERCAWSILGVQI
jgi:hypothetical protein